MSATRIGETKDKDTRDAFKFIFSERLKPNCGDMDTKASFTAPRTLSASAPCTCSTLVPLFGNQFEEVQPEWHKCHPVEAIHIA